MTDDKQRRSRNLAEALCRSFDNLPIPEVSDEEKGGALLNAAVIWAQRAMPPMAVAALLRDIADALEVDDDDDAPKVIN